MDRRMPRVDGVAATGRIATAHPGVRVLVLVLIRYDADADIVPAVEAGATVGCARTRRCRSWPTPCGPPLAGRPCWPRRSPRGRRRGCARQASRMRAPAAGAPTAREREVPAGVARSLTNADFGRERLIGEVTVRAHLLRGFAWLGVDDRTRAVLVAVERGLLPSLGR
jgi:DNA-binding NarL/FixJ family response regulator